MTPKSLSLLLASALFTRVLSHEMAGRTRHGLIGYGIEMYYPTCASACRAVLAMSQLECSEVVEEGGMHGMDMGPDMGGVEIETSDECYASDNSFLQTLALCIHQRCPHDPSVNNLKDERIEEWWHQNAVGTAAEQAEPKESYAKALASIAQQPSEILISGNPLNRTMLVADEDYQSNWNALFSFETAEVTHERYALVVFLSGVVFPIAFSLLRFIPFPPTWTSHFDALVINPPAIGQRHKVPILWGLARMPTRGQALFISYLIIINVVLCAGGYSSYQPNAFFGQTNTEIVTYISNRTGVLSFAHVPLLILYAGRNNILLWVTNWSHETFLLVHRYIAGIATIQAVLHSILYLWLDVMNGSWTEEGKEPYWIWGAVATVGMSVLLPTSILPIRRMFYEAFLLWHIVVSILVVAGCYLHILHRFTHQWGYENWIYIAIAVWSFDRLLRLARVIRNGLKWAVITVIDEDYIRVHIEGVHGSGHAYLCFPSLERYIWQSHPFSVTSAMIERKTPTETSSMEAGLEKEATTTVTVMDLERSSNKESEDTQTTSRVPAMTFFLRTRRGLTSFLRSLGPAARLPVLVESSYGQHSNLSAHPTLICIVGGVGITAVLPILSEHPGRKILLWGVRQSGLVDTLSADLRGIEVKTFVGHRMVVSDELQRLTDDPTIGNHPAVVVSGPEAMADDVRNAVCAIARQRKDVAIRLVEEAFSW